MSTTHTLSPETELRLEVGRATCSVVLKDGSAELYGAEMAQNLSVKLTATKVAIYTWHGCMLEITNEDQLDMIYESSETDSNISFVNTHAQLEALRDAALSSALNIEQALSGGPSAAINSNTEEAKKAQGPRVLLVGPADCGKSTLARILTAYAVKLGRTPLLVDIDPSQNMLSVPGTLAVAPASVDAVNVDSYKTCSIMAGAMAPFTLWYGSEDATSNEDLYKAQVKKLATVIDQRLANDVDLRASGMIINTSGSIDGAGYDYLLHAIDSFRIDVVLVLGHDRLYNLIRRDTNKKAAAAEESKMTDVDFVPPKIINLTRSGGCVTRDSSFRRQQRAASIKRYFYGDMISPKPNESGVIPAPQPQYNPSLVEVSFSDVKLFKVSRVSLSASLLPVSAAQATDPIQLEQIEPTTVGQNFTKKVLAVCHPLAVENYTKSDKARDLYLSGIAGFVVVEKVDTTRSSFSLLSPCVGSLPSMHFLTGDISWHE